MTYIDKALGLTYIASITAYSSNDIFALSAKIESDNPINMEWLSTPVIAASQSSNEMIDYGGQWGGEFRKQINAVGHRSHMRESRSGTTSHANFPGLIIPSKACSENLGSCYGFHYGWSGGHRMIAEQLPDGRRQIQFGNTENSELKSG